MSEERFSPDLTKVASTLELFTKGDYEFIIGEGRSFRKPVPDGAEQIGVRYPLSLAEDGNGYRKGARQIFTCYLHSEGAQSFSKQFLMAALGYKRTRDEEKRFDEDMKGQDWSIDPSTGATGDIWRRANHQRIVLSLDTGVNPNDGTPNQAFKGFAPLAR